MKISSWDRDLLPVEPVVHQTSGGHCDRGRINDRNHENKINVGTW
jgi:hypothetical protein